MLVPIINAPENNWRAGASRSTGTIFLMSIRHPGAAHTVMFYIRTSKYALVGCRHTVMFYVTLNKRNPVTFPNTPQHARAHYCSTERHTRSFSKTLLALVAADTQGHAASCTNQLQHYISLLVLSQLHHFLPYITWIAPARQQWSPFC